MRELRLLLLYVCVVFVGGALMAPWLWKAAQACAAAWPSMARLAHQPFHRYVNRCLLVLAIGGLWPLYKSFGLHGRTEHGWRGPWLRPVAVGTLAGIGSCLLVYGGVLGFGAATWAADLSPRWMAGRVASALATGAAVGVLEEWLFRGLIHGGLRRSLPFPAVAFVTSLLYAAVHFFDRPPQPESMGPLTGVWTLGQMLHGFGEPGSLVPGLLNLFMVGWMLAMVRERTGTLALSMGIHGGWVFGIKLLGSITGRDAATSTFVWGSAKVFDGWAASAVLAIQCMALHVATRRRRASHGADGGS